MIHHAHHAVTNFLLMFYMAAQGLLNTLPAGYGSGPGTHAMVIYALEHQTDSNCNMQYPDNYFPTVEESDIAYGICWSTKDPDLSPSDRATLYTELR